MRLLVLGGSVFAGHAVSREALGQGWDVMVFNRGLSGPDLSGAVVVHGDHANADDLARLAWAGSWEAVIDMSGYETRETQVVARHLGPVVGRYVFVSTVSVYQDWSRKPLTELSEVLYGPPDAGPEYGADTVDRPTSYGYQKSGCALAVRQAFNANRTVILRPRGRSRSAVRPDHHQQRRPHLGIPLHPRQPPRPCPAHRHDSEPAQPAASQPRPARLPHRTGTAIHAAAQLSPPSA